ncbi:MAG: hypothetical protein ACOCZ5_03055 [bacterium]
MKINTNKVEAKPTIKDLIKMLDEMKYSNVIFYQIDEQERSRGLVMLDDNDLIIEFYGEDMIPTVYNDLDDYINAVNLWGCFELNHIEMISIDDVEINCNLKKGE